MLADRTLPIAQLHRNLLCLIADKYAGMLTLDQCPFCRGVPSITAGATAVCGAVFGQGQRRAGRGLPQCRDF